ncbi:hypothetical protein C2845_PM05G01040 [Panicum miliaceum]|uniref:Uncharacterized protein n=1 Tax=Panicum miliaceum TaxID=4540 RepID=A0A3L6T435_PANMI|nr:hypothetical protein C2845_PM05G01040 [Panicum miliaceum]
MASADRSPPAPVPQQNAAASDAMEGGAFRDVAEHVVPARGRRRGMSPLRVRRNTTRRCRTKSWRRAGPPAQERQGQGKAAPNELPPARRSASDSSTGAAGQHASGWQAGPQGAGRRRAASRATDDGCGCRLDED